MTEPLFSSTTQISLGGKAGTFRAKEHFALNVDPGPNVLISYILANFQRWFLDKTESAVEATTLYSQELQRNAADGIILAELGGELAVETTLTEVFTLMEYHRAGREGILVTNGWGNIFYIRDVSNTLRAVYVHWCDGGWNIEAVRVGRMADWPIRDRVVSRRPRNLEI